MERVKVVITKRSYYTHPITFHFEMNLPICELWKVNVSLVERWYCVVTNNEGILPDCTYPGGDSGDVHFLRCFIARPTVCWIVDATHTAHRHLLSHLDRPGIPLLCRTPQSNQLLVELKGEI